MADCFVDLGAPLGGAVSACFAPPALTAIDPEVAHRQNAHRVQAAACPLEDLVADAKEVEWLVQGALPLPSAILLGGEAKKGGKSMLTMALAIAVARGTPFLGMPVKQGPVLLCDFEDDYDTIGRRARWYGLIANSGLPIYLVRDKGVIPSLLDGGLAAFCPKPVLCILDSLTVVRQALGLTKENDNDEMYHLGERLHELAHAAICSLVTTHHFRKAGDQMRGASGLLATVDGWWDAVLGKNGSRLLSWVLRCGAAGEIGVDLEINESEKSLCAVACSADDARPAEKGSGKSNGSSNGSNGHGESSAEHRARMRVIARLYPQAGKAPESVPFRALREYCQCGTAVLKRVLAIMELSGDVRTGEGGVGWLWAREHAAAGEPLEGAAAPTISNSGEVN